MRTQLNQFCDHFVAAVRPVLEPLATTIAALVLAGTASAGATAQQFQDQTAARFPVLAQYSNQCAIADIEGDGDLDLVFANGGGFPCAGPDQ